MNEGAEVLSVGQLYRKSKNALAREFRGPVWVAGEIKSIREQRGNWYIALTEPGDFNDGTDITLDIACWSKKRLVIQEQLASAGIRLVAGMEVRVYGNVTLGKFGKVLVELVGLDTEALLGKQQAEKRLLFEALVKQGLADKNRLLDVPLVPLRVGLVTSEGSDGFNDFLGELQRSGFNFAVSLVHSPVQGPTAPNLLGRAIASFSADEVDLVAVVRGGGGELDAFDKEPVVRAIANAPVPVWTGVGHTADRSLSDEISNQSFITPTACGQAIVGTVGAYADRVQSAGRHIGRTVRSRLDLAESQLHRSAEAARRCTDRDLALAAVGNHRLRSELSRSVRTLPDRSAEQLAGLSGRLRTATDRRLERLTSSQELWRARVKQFDPQQAVDRGYTLSYDGNGKLVRSVKELKAGDALKTRFADGTISSTVTEMQAEPKSTSGPEMQAEPKSTSGPEMQAEPKSTIEAGIDG